MLKTRLFLAGIPSASIPDAAAFYRDVLGFSVVQQGPTFCFLDAGPMMIVITPPPPDSRPGGGIWLTVQVNDMVLMLERLKEHGVAVERDEESPNGRLVYVADPDGHAIELQEVRASP